MVACATLMESTSKGDREGSPQNPGGWGGRLEQMG